MPSVSGKGPMQLLGLKAFSIRLHLIHYCLFIFDQPSLYTFYISAVNERILRLAAMERTMSWIPLEWIRHPSEANSSAKTPNGLRIASMAVRTVFIVLLLLITLRVSMPQSETFWTAYETPADLLRMVLGFAICLWLAIQLFTVPKDASAYRTWLYLGLVALPFAVICIVAIW
jgi:hypothetical protein